jgi:lipopolysaccharide-induced tumor necrosis factor-alpha factor
MLPIYKLRLQILATEVNNSFRCFRPFFDTAFFVTLNCFTYVNVQKNPILLSSTRWRWFQSWSRKKYTYQMETRITTTTTMIHHMRYQNKQFHRNNIMLWWFRFPRLPIQSPPQTHPQQPPRPVVVYGHLGRYECNMQCPFCAEMILTETRTRCDVVTWLFFVLLLFFFWPLCWLPFCMPTCQGVHHYCPKCHRQVGATDSCS